MSYRMTDLSGLLARVEVAARPDRHLDAAIYDAFGDDGSRVAFKVDDWSVEPGLHLSRYHDGWLIGRNPQDQYADDLPRYTASIDAALALVEKVMPLALQAAILQFMHEGVVGGHCWLYGPTTPNDSDIELHGEGHAKALPLAILAALLRAKIGPSS